MYSYVRVCVFVCVCCGVEKSSYRPMCVCRLA